MYRPGKFKNIDIALKNGFPTADISKELGFSAVLANPLDSLKERMTSMVKCNCTKGL